MDTVSGGIHQVLPAGSVFSKWKCLAHGRQVLGGLPGASPYTHLFQKDRKAPMYSTAARGASDLGRVNEKTAEGAPGKTFISLMTSHPDWVECHEVTNVKDKSGNQKWCGPIKTLPPKSYLRFKAPSLQLPPSCTEHIPNLLGNPSINGRWMKERKLKSTKGSDD